MGKIVEYTALVDIDEAMVTMMMEASHGEEDG